ncbi:unnamed protein product [Nippostrongylus brasiliensis]|uniref:Secreted protein n=1 Tax=Nippostrongylus brasiliensis TaxID=27835 RepID=A0A0N4XLQ1_NIPBR|nr:unnamed protein product [Nippostrongylus brasiliensis]
MHAKLVAAAAHWWSLSRRRRRRPLLVIACSTGLLPAIHPAVRSSMTSVVCAVHTYNPIFKALFDLENRNTNYLKEDRLQ